MRKRRFKNKYRVDTWRHPCWNYSGNGAYFITICTQNRKKYFGKITTSSSNNNECIIHLSQLGKIAFNYWQDISIHFPSVLTDAFVVMPDHVHGILILQKPNVEAQNFAPLQYRISNNGSENTNRFGPQAKNLASIIRGYKAGVKTYAVNNNLDFAWQKRYYDRIIRDVDELNRIREYIYSNIGKHQPT
jgi:putative transposase